MMRLGALRRVAAQQGSRSLHTSRASFNMIKVNVDGMEVEIPNGATVMQACEEADVDIPRFCYHDRLSIAGNCRMCLVEVVKSPKPVASCAMPAMPGMEIFTSTPLVKKAREGVIEFMLSNHPLDCPICDQGGECDLQDQSVAFGSGLSRFNEMKRSVEDKNIGPLVKTVMTRCIHCTRCVRFVEEIAGTPIMGATGRGNNMEIGTYVDQVLDSELSGNVIDLCPVGALTSKPYAFVARPWELTHVETVDVHDAVGSNIRVDTRGSDILRILPRLNEDVNEEWISDKTRFSYDGLVRQRLDSPMIKSGEDYHPVSWQEVFFAIKNQVAAVQGNQISAVAGDMTSAETLICAKDLMNRLGSSNLEPSADGTRHSADLRSDYLFNSTILGVEDADVILLVGTNPRMEAPLVAARMRKAQRHYGVQIANIGPAADLAIEEVEELGNDSKILNDIAKGRHPFSKVLAGAERPMLVLGMSALQHQNSKQVMESVRGLTAKFPNLATEDWNGVNMLHTAASRAAALDIGFVPGPNAKPLEQSKVVFLFGADDAKLISRIPEDAFVVYQGHHGDEGASRADVILPEPVFTEKTATYVNTEGRPQRTMAASNKLDDARDDWQIVRALSEVLGAPLPYNTLDAVRERLLEVSPTFSRVGEVEHASFISSDASTLPEEKGKAGPFTRYFDNFYMTNPITRSSKVMARAAATLPTAKNSYI